MLKQWAAEESFPTVLSLEQGWGQLNERGNDDMQRRIYDNGNRIIKAFIAMEKALISAVCSFWLDHGTVGPIRLPLTRLLRFLFYRSGYPSENMAISPLAAMTDDEYSALCSGSVRFRIPHCFGLLNYWLLATIPTFGNGLDVEIIFDA